MIKYLHSKVFSSFDKAAEQISEWHSVSDAIVFTNGCFDILHAGHVSYLEEAKELGDKLIIGLNTDGSVQRLKGLARPVNSENERAMVLAGLASVDMVIYFQEDTPVELIHKVKPQFLVKGGDYTLEEIDGADFVMEHNGKVKILSYLEGISTTSIIDKIKKSES